MLQRVAACCRAMQCVAVCCSALQCVVMPVRIAKYVEVEVRQCVAECYRVMQSVAYVQCFAECCGARTNHKVRRGGGVCVNVLQCVVVSCSVLPCDAVCCCDDRQVCRT